MTVDPESAPDEGRSIRLTPVGPGVWLVLLGSGVMVLGPLFGFLIGTVLGTEGETLGMTPIFFFLFLGFIVGGAGLVVALFGARRILRNRLRQHAREAEADQRAA